MNVIVAVFILLQPFLDLLTGLCLHLLEINLTIGIIVRVLFLIFICLVVLFVFKKKNLLVPYFIIGLYFIFYIIGMILYKDGGLFQEIQGLVKTFYFPILFISLFAIRDEIKISKLTLLTTLFFYLIFIFVPLLLGIGYKSYEITKAGTLGFFNSANEISGIISLLTPIMFIVFASSKKIFPKVILGLMYLIVILMVGTKTPLLCLGITATLSILYLWFYSVKTKKYKNIVISVIIMVVGIGGLLITIPKTNFYKNIETHLDYLKLDNVTEVFSDSKLIDHFIFSQRLTFLHDKALIYKESSTYEKVFGIGYLQDNKATKMIEMDYFDIFYSHGVVGFLIFFLITLYILYKILEKSAKFTYTRCMLQTCLLLIIILSLFTGHIITAPSVSLLCIILILSLAHRPKKDLIFVGKNMEIGGIENAQVNLLDNINYNKYKVTLILEEKKGPLLNKINKNVTIKELKVSSNKNVLIRKTVNVIRKLIFKILNYQNYDFSCCYTTYSYSCDKIARMSSTNTAFYVHSDYQNVYHNEKDFQEFFDSRHITEYKHIIFVSQESKASFLKYYKDLESKTLVLNNFINIEEIKKQSKQEITAKKSKDKKLFVFVGRLDDSSKKVKRALNIIKEIKNTELWIIGDGPDRKMYEDYAGKEKITSRVTFFGRQENPYPYMEKADYIILTSDYEGFPVTYLEALILKKQIITTISTSDEEIDMKNYAYIIPKDSEKMVKEVQEILSKEQKKKTLNLEDIQLSRKVKLEQLFNE